MAKELSVLFVGNSHTYYNDMPGTVRRLALEAGFHCRVAMIAHPGWFLSQHVADPEARFNILYGGYDYVVLQEHAHPFGPEQRFREAAAALNGWIREAGSRPVIYETWARKAEPEAQARMNEAHRRVAEEIGALLAPVGERWWDWIKAHPDAEMYDPDGAHASAAGSEFAAAQIWETIRGGGR